MLLALKLWSELFLCSWCGDIFNWIPPPALVGYDVIREALRARLASIIRKRDFYFFPSFMRPSVASDDFTFFRACRNFLFSLSVSWFYFTSDLPLSMTTGAFLEMSVLCASLSETDAVVGFYLIFNKALSNFSLSRSSFNAFSTVLALACDCNRFKCSLCVLFVSKLVCSLIELIADRCFRYI